jgi:hypothetical protein
VTISPEQIKAARGLLGWSYVKLSINSGVGLVVVQKIETGKQGIYPSATLKLKALFEAAGIEFTNDDGEDAGVRLRKP